MQSDELASLPVGTEVSAKYKGAFCEAKVKKVHRQVKCKVTFKQALGSFMLCDSLLTYNGPLVANITVEAKHPEKGTVQEAVVNKIYDQSQYTVVFDDGDIATLRRNALCMKSGKHFNASESLDNLPLTHPEHFGTPVGSRRRRFGEEYEEEEEDDDSSDDEAESVPYISKLGTVVCVEVSDKKSTKSRENWFPGLVVSPHAQDQVKINTKEDFLIRSFKDHRYYTVPKKECKKFHKDIGKGVTEAALSKAVDHALAYLDNNENLPVHWDREILFDMRDDSSTEGSSDEEELLLSDDEDVQSPEEKDHLVAELYKHMEDKGTPINKTPSIGDQDIDLYKLFRLVQKLRGQQQVTNNNQWRTVAKKLGFETNWCVNQVRVCYKRYLHSFEELYRTLRCTLNNHPRNSLRVRHGSGRPLARGVRSGSKIKEEDISDRSSVSSQDSGELNIKREIKEEIFDEIELEGVKQKIDFDEKKIKKSQNVVDKIIKDEPLDEEMEIFDQSKKGKDTKGSGKKGKEDIRMLTRPRRDSTSSLAAATELKAKKDEIGEPSKIKKEPKPKKMKEEDDRSDSGSNGGKVIKTKKNVKKKEEDPVQMDFPEDECSSDVDSSLKKKKGSKKKGGKAAELAPVEPPCGSGDGEEPQHLKPSVECAPSDKIKVFWLHGQIYEAKIIKVEKLDIDKWPKFYVHYQGWNQRYDEWITRGRIAENLTWNANPLKQKHSKSATPPPEKQKGKSDKMEKPYSEDEEKQDSEDKTISEEEKEIEVKKKIKKAKSSTPTSTPSSSRTSSPASNRRTKSPAPKRANSPIVKERTPIKDKKKEIIKRTNSPAQRKSPQLKRQSSRNSLFKQSDDDFEDISDAEEEDDKGPRRSARGEKEAMDVKVETPKRPSKSGSNARTEPKTEKVSEAEEEDEKKVEVSRSSARLKGPSTPTQKNNKSSDSDDPYVFQEPEPLESPIKSETPGSPDNMEDEDLDRSIERDSRKQEQQDEDDSFLLDESLNKIEDDVNEEIEKLEEDSSDPPEEVMQILTPVKDIEAEDDYENDEPMYHEMEIDDMEEDDLALESNELIVKDYKEEEEEDEEEEDEEEVKQEKAESEKGGKPVLHLNDRYASLFPHLASLRAVSTTSSSTTVQNTISSSSDTSISSIQITSANMISSIVESSILKETTLSVEHKSPASLSEVKSEDSEKEKISSDGPSMGPKEEPKDDNKKDIKLFKESQTPTKPRTRNKKSKKVRSLRNPTHKSREVVTDSDTDSEDEKPKIKPITPRRKTIENERIKTPLKRLKQMDSDDECSLLKRMKKRKDDDDDSLVCQETIPGSPVHSGANESPSKVNPARDERNSSSRLEMPFASVPESAVIPKVNQPANPISATVQTTLPIPDSPPPTPESSNSVEGPVITQPKEDGSKSPAESSEVDMESLSGRGKAGSEDSRLDVECSSSSDTRLGRGRRRQPTQRETEKEMEQSPQTFKRKRKTRVENAGRGRGKGRGRNSSGVGRGVGRQMEDTDDSERDIRSEDPRLDRLDNAALAALAHPKPNTTSKYNFYVQLNPNMDQTERISKIQKTLEELRKTYLNVKGDLSAIERRRKKIRRKERERTQQTTEVAA
eukprot:TRINITY_DN18857_c0_g1_i1.p1 TRINITY_DN18857_c0_g1~~TRINITY_DN18857_c0_g1_i1.p1  ORF type:complete len:1601 (-),score=506.46 TRINITY_DN18857_c0_g1_i1:766-5568(-)